jgi:long-chain acyl-CoA synthetase
VALVMRNLPEWPVVFYAASVAGAIVVPLNAWLTGPELQYALMDCGARFLVADPERLERLDPLLSGCRALEHVYVVRDDRPASGVTRLESLIGSPAAWSDLPRIALPDIDLQPEDDATIFYTSGTTGAPKGVLATHRNMHSNIVGAACAAARVHLRRGVAAPEPGSLQPGALVSIPFFHVTGAFAILSPALHGGMKLVLMRRWNAEEAMRLIERDRVTAIVGVPSIAWQLIEHPARDRYDLSSLVSLGYGGASAAPDLIRQIERALPVATPGHGWGMTETSALVTTHSAEDYANRPDSCGPAVPVSDLKIMSADGLRALPPGEVGELWVSGPQIAKGYWNDPEASARVFADGWVRTGDLARLDDEGFCYIVDRLKDMVIRGGENIYCVEVENALYEHPAVMDAAVVGAPHRTLGQEPAAVVSLVPGGQATEDELRQWVRGRLAAFKAPVKVVFWPEPLPRNANGKILKAQLKDVFAEDP